MEVVEGGVVECLGCSGLSVKGVEGGVQDLVKVAAGLDEGVKVVEVVYMVGDGEDEFGGEVEEQHWVWILDATQSSRIQ